MGCSSGGKSSGLISRVSARVRIPSSRILPCGAMAAHLTLTQKVMVRVHARQYLAYGVAAAHVVLTHVVQVQVLIR